MSFQLPSRSPQATRHGRDEVHTVASSTSRGRDRQHALLSLSAMALVVAGGLMAARQASAASASGVESWLTGDGLVIGAAVGSTDYGTGFKAEVGSGGTGRPLGPVPGLWRWEAQLQSFGSETFVQFGNSFKRSAWSLGGSLMPQLPLMPGVTGYAKLGVHYLSSQASGPGLSTSTSGIKPGIGAGLRWQAHPRVGLRLEYENIGSSGGDVVSLGVELPF